MKVWVATSPTNKPVAFETKPTNEQVGNEIDGEFELYEIPVIPTPSCEHGYINRHICPWCWNKARIQK